MTAITAPLDSDDDADVACEYCGGSGADPWEVFMPCGHCDGAGYRWWE